MAPWSVRTGVRKAVKVGIFQIVWFERPLPSPGVHGRSGYPLQRQRLGRRCRRGLRVVGDRGAHSVGRGNSWRHIACAGARIADRHQRPEAPAGQHLADRSGQSVTTDGTPSASASVSTFGEPSPGRGHGEQPRVSVHACRIRRKEARRQQRIWQCRFGASAVSTTRPRPSPDRKPRRARSAHRRECAQQRQSAASVSPAGGGDQRQLAFFPSTDGARAAASCTQPMASRPGCGSPTAPPATGQLGACRRARLQTATTCSTSRTAATHRRRAQPLLQPSLAFRAPPTDWCRAAHDDPARHAERARSERTAARIARSLAASSAAGLSAAGNAPAPGSPACCGAMPGSIITARLRQRAGCRSRRGSPADRPTPCA